MEQRTPYTRMMITNRYILLVVLLHLFSVISNYHLVNAATYETDDAIIVEGEYHRISKQYRFEIHFHFTINCIRIKEETANSTSKMTIKTHGQFYYFGFHSNSDFVIYRYTLRSDCRIRNTRIRRPGFGHQMVLIRVIQSTNRKNVNQTKMFIENNRRAIGDQYS